MTNDNDEFDASDAAARAIGDMADGQDVGGDDPPDDPSHDTETTDNDDTESASAVGVTGMALALVTASPSGPTANGLRNLGLGEHTAHVIDGLVDWLLDVAGMQGGPVDDVRDDLGPLGKIGRGVSGWMDTQTTTDDSGDSGNEAGGPDHGDAPNPGGVTGV